MNEQKVYTRVFQVQTVIFIRIEIYSFCVVNPYMELCIYAVNKLYILNTWGSTPYSELPSPYFVLPDTISVYKVKTEGSDATKYY